MITLMKKRTTTHLPVRDLQRQGQTHKLQRISVDHQKRTTQIQNSSSICRYCVSMVSQQMNFYQYAKHSLICSLLSIKGRQDLLPSLHWPDFRHSLGRPYLSAPHHEPDLLCLSNVIIKQFKPPRENNEVSKFAYRHRAKRLFKAKSRCCVGSRGTNNLNNRSVNTNMAA